MKTGRVVRRDTSRQKGGAVIENMDMVEQRAPKE